MPLTVVDDDCMMECAYREGNRATADIASAAAS
jgi:hypothetical protein